MKYQISTTKTFRKSYRSAIRNSRFDINIYDEVIRKLANGEELESKYNDHALKGNLIGNRECHLAPDLLLMYRIENDILVLTLINIGNHAKLFKQ